MDLIEVSCIVRKRELHCHDDDGEMPNAKRPKLNESLDDRHHNPIFIKKSPLEVTPYDIFELIARYLTHRNDIMAMWFAGSQIVNRRLVSTITSLQIDNKPYNHLLQCFTKLRQLSITNTSYDNSYEICRFPDIQVDKLCHLQEVVVDAPVPNIPVLLESLPRSLQKLHLGCINPHKQNMFDGRLLSRFGTLKTLLVSPFNKGLYDGCYLNETYVRKDFILDNSHCLPPSLVELVFIGSITMNSKWPNNVSLPPNLQHLTVDVLTCNATSLPSTLKVLSIRFASFINWNESCFVSSSRPPLIIELTSQALCQTRPVYPDNVTHVVLVESCIPSSFKFGDVYDMRCLSNLKKLTLRTTDHVNPTLVKRSAYPASLEEIDMSTYSLTERNVRLHIPNSITSLTARSVLLEYDDVVNLLTTIAPNLRQITCGELCVSPQSREFIKNHRVGPEKSVGLLVNERKCI
jgi:hypothetical protein